MPIVIFTYMKMQYKVIGVMSGTSLDGVDLVLMNLSFNDKWSFKMLYSETIPYPEKWFSVLKNLVKYDLHELKAIDEDYTNYLGAVIKEFITKNNIKAIDAVCSHGHTALHQPEKKLTYQIGNLPKLAKIINEIVVCDFRVQDVKLGGQGAPLVPIGDKLLFAEYDFCINLGGFANISTDIKGERIAYDICPVNIVLNHYVGKLGFKYDNKGDIAKSGNLNKELLEKLNEQPFYNLNYPKSLGLEWVNTNIFPLIDTFKLSEKDILKTFVEHIATQITKEINKKRKGKVLITGGGAYNSYLVQSLKFKTDHEIIIPNPQVVEFKEALIFGLLGVLKLTERVNCLKSVTGAIKNHSSGEIFIA